MKPIAWSWSRLSDFEQCPRMFQGKYVSKDFPKESFTSPHLIRGKDIHKELEDALTKGLPLHPSRAWLAPVINAVKYQAMMQAELQVCFDQRRHVKSWFDKAAWCRMIFDVICSQDDELVIMLDWKTGKVRHESKDQLRLFAAGALDRFPDANRVLTAYVWVDHPTEKMTYVEYNRSQLEHIWEEFGDRAELIQLAQESGNWIEKPTFKCMFCPANVGQCSNMTTELKDKRAAYEAKNR